MQVRKSIIGLAALLVCAPASAQFELVTLVEAVELTPANFILPGSTNGMMTYRGCTEDCDRDYERARLTAATTFTVNGQNVKFGDFRRSFAQVSNSHDHYALVSVDLKAGTVTNITLAL